jgi:four helix bundle protein
MRYDDLDAFRICHELTLQVHAVVKRIDEQDPDLAGELWLAALRAPSRIARGAGCGNRRMFAQCLNRALGALAEMGYHLDLAQPMGLVSDEERRTLEGLRGRAIFYTLKLLTVQQTEPDREDDGPAP